MSDELIGHVQGKHMHFNALLFKFGSGKICLLN